MSLISEVKNAEIETGITDFGHFEKVFFIKVIGPKISRGPMSVRLSIDSLNTIIKTYFSGFGNNSLSQFVDTLPDREQSEEICRHFSKYAANKPLILQTIDGEVVNFVLHGSEKELEIALMTSNKNSDDSTFNFEISDWNKVIKKMYMLGLFSN